MSDVLFDSEFYKKLASIKLHMKLRPGQGLSGNRKSAARGSSLEFSDFREYLLGDDIRHIDWNAYGRTGKLLVKLFLEEKEGRFHIFVDGSKSMEFGEAKKSIQSLRIAAALAYVILSNLDRVYLTTCSEKGLATSRGLIGKQAFNKIIRQLEEATFTANTGLEQMIYIRPFSAKGMTILISDFFLEQDMEPLLRYLVYQKQKVLLIHVLAAEEQQPRLEGTLSLIDSENEKKLKVTMDHQVLRAYDRAYQEFCDRLQGLCRKYGAAYLFASSDMSLDKLLFDFFGKKQNSE